VADSEECNLAFDSSTCQKTNFECSWPSTVLLGMSHVLSSTLTFSGETKIKLVVSCRQNINLMSGAVVAQRVMSFGCMDACGFIVGSVVFCFHTIQTSCGSHPFS
jgi:propanediol utilization protein